MSSDDTRHELYEPPSITSIGRIEDLAQGGAIGKVLDADFPRGTPFADLTFS
jgi:hypothetical protein